MNSIPQALQDYQALQHELAGDLDGWTPAELKSAQVSTEQHRYDWQQLSEHLSTLQQASGWLLYPGRVITLPLAEEELPTDSMPLSGEMKLNEKHMRLTHLGASQWMFSSSVIQWVETDQARHLLERVSQQPTTTAPGVLNYWRVWGINDNQQLAIEAALFDGFAGDKQGEQP